MDNFGFKTQAGQSVVLSEMDMQRVHEHYVLQNTADFVRENYPSISENNVQLVASRTRERMDKYNEDEGHAIHCAMRDVFLGIKNIRVTT